MMARSQPFVKGRIAVALVRLLVFSLMLVIGGFTASYQTGRKIAAFHTDGQSVLGTITKKYAQTSGALFYLYVQLDRSQLYWVDVAFKSQDGKLHSESTGVSNKLYEQMEVGSPVRVTYARSNPGWFYLAGEAPADRDVAIFIAMFQCGMIMSLVLAVFLTASVFWYRGSEAPGAPSARMAQQRGISRVEQLQRRAGLQNTSKSMMLRA